MAVNSGKSGPPERDDSRAAAMRTISDKLAKMDDAALIAIANAMDGGASETEIAAAEPSAIKALSGALADPQQFGDGSLAATLPSPSRGPIAWIWEWIQKGFAVLLFVWIMYIVIRGMSKVFNWILE